MREIKKFHHKGQGKAGAAFHEIPPTDFFPDISDVNERKVMFFKQCKEELKLSRNYLTWLDKEFNLFSSHNTASPKKELEEGTFTLTKERSSGQNIFDTSKKTVLKQPYGTTTERVVKQTFANITVRGKRKNCDDSEAGLRKQAKLVDDILEHTSRHDKSTKAKLLAKIIDRNGPLFGKEIKMKSKRRQFNKPSN